MYFQDLIPQGIPQIFPFPPDDPCLLIPECYSLYLVHTEYGVYIIRLRLVSGHVKGGIRTILERRARITSTNK